MKLVPGSIAGRLVFLFLAGSALVLVCAGAFLSAKVKDIVIASLDHTLHSKRQMITGLVHEEHGGIEFELSEIIAGEYVIPRSGHYYRVMMDNAVLAVSPSLVDDNFVFVPEGPVQSIVEDPGDIVFTSTGPDDEPVRVLRYEFRAFDRSFDITIAESLTDSLAMVAEFRHVLFIFIPLTFLVLCFAAWWIARTSLRPLKSFSTSIEAITHKNLTERIHAGTTELAGIADSFNALLDRLNTVFESRRRLFADASHELKTPVSVIRTQCDVVLQRPRTAEEYAEALRTIRASSLGMAKLINDLLALARFDAGRLTPGEFGAVSLKECIMQAVEMVGPLANERQVRVSAEIEDALIVQGSDAGLSEAFLNLVENAVKYNMERGSVSVSAVSRDGKTVITVRDTGIGIAERDLERIFERFYRADAVRSLEGTGLGLSIVKFVIEAHGGEIAVQSEPGRGSTFRVVLPAVQQQA